MGRRIHSCSSVKEALRSIGQQLEDIHIRQFPGSYFSGLGKSALRVRINYLELLGTSRRVEFRPGLNIITGPITTGKTSLLRLVRGLLGSSLTDFPLEVRQRVSALSGSVILNDSEYAIVRHFASTPTAKVEVAGPDGAWRLPALQRDETSSITYGHWLLETLGLPRLEVPSAPTNIQSPPTPISINDYLLFCELRQDEIDNSVYGHRDNFKNIKRKYVFQIVYGLYDIETARLQDEAREVYGLLTQHRHQMNLAEKLFKDTPLENRAELQRQLQLARQDLAVITNQIHTDAAVTIRGDSPSIQYLRNQVKALDSELNDLNSKLSEERTSIRQLGQLLAQLEAQSSRLTKAIVAGEYLLDIEFVICPRCGASVDQNRGELQLCCLCLQEPKPLLAKETLVREQERIHSQIAETKELIDAHERAVLDIEKTMGQEGKQRSQLAEELDFRTTSYLSDRTQKIVEYTQIREAVKSRIQRLEDYLALTDKLNLLLVEISGLEKKKEEIEARLQVAADRSTKAEDHIQRLERRFHEILQIFQAPRFDVNGDRIDRQTFLSIYDGRRFDDLSSQGLQVLVNVAHALAHQLTTMDLGLSLPNILFIDGLTSNIGHEGEDLERVRGVYKYLVFLFETHGDKLQIIVADNDVPETAKEFIRVRLSEADRLIPPN